MKKCCNIKNVLLVLLVLLVLRWGVGDLGLWLRQSTDRAPPFTVVVGPKGGETDDDGERRGTGRGCDSGRVVGPRQVFRRGDSLVDSAGISRIGGNLSHCRSS